MKIAIIDDKPYYVQAFEVILRDAGHEVLPVIVTQASYAEALEKVRRFGPDRVLLDHILGVPGLSGKDMADALSLPKERLIGTSSSSQAYCGRRFPAKALLLTNAARKMLLEIIA